MGRPKNQKNQSHGVSFVAQTRQNLVSNENRFSKCTKKGKFVDWWAHRVKLKNDQSHPWSGSIVVIKLGGNQIEQCKEYVNIETSDFQDVIDFFSITEFICLKKIFTVKSNKNLYFLTFKQSR